MALNDMTNGSPFYMPVQPAYNGGYGNGGSGFFGGDWAWIILLLLIGGGGWGFGGGFGMGGMMWPMMMGAGMGGGFGLDYLYPWLNNSQHISDGFRDQQLNSQIGDLRSDVGRGFGDVQLGIAGLGRQICETGNGITQAVNNGFSAAEIAANGRQMANMQTQFGIQSAIQGGAAANAAGIADLKYTVAQEACADRAALTQGLQTQTMQEMSNTNALMSALRDGIQSIKDELCADRIEGYKRQIADEQRENANLRSDLLYARNLADRTAQTATFQQGFANEVDALYNRLNTCPVPTTPVYGRTPIFTCGGQSVGCGCGGNGFVN